MKMTPFQKLLTGIIEHAIEIKAAHAQGKIEGYISASINDDTAKAAYERADILSFRDGRRVNLARHRMTPEEVNDTGNHDSRPYQADVAQAIINAGGSEYQAWQAADDAIHLPPEYIAEKYGKAAGEASRRLQEHHEER